MFAIGCQILFAFGCQILFEFGSQSQILFVKLNYSSTNCETVMLSTMQRVLHFQDYISKARYVPESADCLLIVVVGRPHVCEHQGLAISTQTVLQQAGQFGIPEKKYSSSLLK